MGKNNKNENNNKKKQQKQQIYTTKIFLFKCTI